MDFDDHRLIIILPIDNLDDDEEEDAFQDYNQTECDMLTTFVW